MHRSTTVAFAIAAVCAVLPVSVQAFPEDTSYARPGIIANVRGHGLNFHCAGTGSPAIVLDAGWEDWSAAWATVQPAMARSTRVCSYDRAGSGFSDPGTFPRSSERIATELHDALHAAKISAPYVFVGHSFGSYTIRTYFDKYPADVAGMVIVDGENDDVMPPDEARKDMAELTDVLPPLERCARAIEAGGPLPLVDAGSRHKRVACNRVFFRGLPERRWSKTLNDTIIAFTATTPPLYAQVVSEARMMPYDARYLQTHVRSLGTRPLRILTAMRHFGDLSTAPASKRREASAFEAMNASAQSRWLALSRDARQIFAWKSSHYIQFDEPEIVIAAVRDVVLRVRAR